MTVQELRDFKVDLLDLAQELATDPVPNTDEIEQQVEAFFSRLETVIGEKTRTTAR